jgi:hypothetical protein
VGINDAAFERVCGIECGDQRGYIAGGNIDDLDVSDRDRFRTRSLPR